MNRAQIAGIGSCAIGLGRHQTPDRIVDRCPPHRAQIVPVAIYRVGGLGVVPSPLQTVKLIIVIVELNLRGTGLVRHGRDLRDQVAIGVVAVVNRSRFGIVGKGQPRERIVLEVALPPVSRVRVTPFLDDMFQVIQRVVVIVGLVTEVAVGIGLPNCKQAAQSISLVASLFTGLICHRDCRKLGIISIDRIIIGMTDLGYAS